MLYLIQSLPLILRGFDIPCKKMTLVQYVTSLSALYLYYFSSYNTPLNENAPLKSCKRFIFLVLIGIIFLNILNNVCTFWHAYQLCFTNILKKEIEIGGRSAMFNTHKKERRTVYENCKCLFLCSVEASYRKCQLNPK